MTTAEELKMNNQSGKFWLLEDPEEIYTDKNVIRYYPKAKRLVVHLPDYYHIEKREVLPGKGTGLRLDYLDPESVKRLIEILSSFLDEDSEGEV